MDLADLREQIHDGCSVAVQVERRVRGQRDPMRLWMGLRGFGHDDAVMADFVLLNDPTADPNGAVNCTMALVDFMRYFTGRAIALRAKPRDIEANRPRRLRCELVPGGAQWLGQRLHRCVGFLVLLVILQQIGHPLVGLSEGVHFHRLALGVALLGAALHGYFNIELSQEFGELSV